MIVGSAVVVFRDRSSFAWLFLYPSQNSHEYSHSSRVENKGEKEHRRPTIMHKAIDIRISPDRELN